MENTRKLQAKKRIALVAHDNKKHELIEWVEYNKRVLSQHELYGTGTTGTMIENATGLKVQKLLSGPMGGDLQIGSMIAEEKIGVVVFFWDPMEAQPHDPDIKALLRVSVVWNIPMACNRSTADFLITSPLMYEEYEAKMTDYSKYMTRKIPA
ncbi:MAG: methylglyoxal synthase [Chitinophagaceae bacterium]|jgi:methylglyoxal synthase|nr:MAG: methylglyoxal synthase [Chitinophagaceae bacterium]